MESRVGAYDNSQHTAVTLAVKLTRVSLRIRRTRSRPSFRLCATSRGRGMHTCRRVAMHTCLKSEGIFHWIRG
ncbi:unnamed protein product [Citrullus colocynthis]|uniref:Uncharacterized protein n=1 Tax=Citrullus colocynthis TaxID=252529 RepID=A0ABP0YK47_9ROSI